ncbi:MAG: UDP-glucose 4-epimerase GalE [Oligoflexus sp.]
MKFFVIGGAGYIGSHFVRQAIDTGHECVVYDNFSLGHKAAIAQKASIIVGDILHASHLQKAIEVEKPDAIMHFAAFALVGESVKNPQNYYENNVEGVRTLLNLMKEICPQTPLIFSSTCAVFGVPERLPIAEDDRKAPFSPYGRSKLMAEFLIEDYVRAYQMKAMSLRYFNACGAHVSGEIGEDHQPETHLLPNILQAAMKGQDLVIFGSDFPTPDGTCLRDYIHVMDLADSHLQAAQYLLQKPAATYDVIHLGTGRGYSNLEILRTVEKTIGQNLTFRFAAPRAGDPPALFAATEKAQLVLGFTPKYSDLPTIISTAWEWHKKHPAGYGSVE